MQFYQQVFFFYLIFFSVIVFMPENLINPSEFEDLLGFEGLCSVEWFRSSQTEVFCKKCVLRNFAKFTENTCAKVSFLIG